MSPEEREANNALESLIARYLEAEKSGQRLDRDGLIEEHPDLADSLRDFFANHDRMKAAANLDEPTLPPTGGDLVDPTMPPNLGSQVATIPPQSVGDDLALPPTERASNPAQPSVGDQVRYFGDYELLEEIARGGMGVVFKARQVNLNRIVALKMILAGQFAGPEDIQRFYTEAEAAANLDHPGIVPIFEIGEHTGQHYFSMAYVEGESLAHRVVNGPLPPREAVELVKKICEAMAYAHERGVIHRDLKPANILIDRNGQPKVTDFGLAKKLEADSNLTGTGQILGTPAYMPPEQASGKTNVGPLADVYSIGAILYCLLTGRPPFQAATPMDTLLQVLDREPLSPKELNAAVPTDLETICLKCLRKDATERYETAGQLGSDLSCYLAGEPIQARPIGRVGRAWKWCKRKPIVATLSAATLILLVAVCVVTTASYVAVASTLSRLRASLSQTMNSAEAGPGLRAGAAIALWELDHDANSVMPTLVECLNSEHTGTELTFRKIVRTLKESESAREKSSPALVALLLANQDVLDRIHVTGPGIFNPSKEFAARTLVEIGSPAVEPLLLGFRDPGNQDRGWGIRPDQTRMPPLFEAIRDLRNTVADPSRIDAALLECCATHLDRDIRNWATEILGTREEDSSRGPAPSGVADYRNMQHWINNLESDDPYKRAWATYFLSHYRPASVDSWKTTIALMAANLNAPEEVVRLQSAHSLAIWSLPPRKPGEETGETTREIARAVVPETIKAIGQIERFPLALRALVTILENMGFEAEEAVPVLVELLTGEQKVTSSDDILGRVEAAEALGRFGSDAKAAVPDLIELLHDDRVVSASVRQAVGDAIIKIDLDALIKFKRQLSDGEISGEVRLDLEWGYKTLLGLPTSRFDGDFNLVKVRRDVSFAEEGLSFFGVGLKSLGDIGEADLATVEITEDKFSQHVKVVKGHTYIARAKSDEEKGHFVVFRVTDVTPDGAITMRFRYR